MFNRLQIMNGKLCVSEALLVLTKIQLCVARWLDLFTVFNDETWRERYLYSLVLSVYFHVSYLMHRGLCRKKNICKKSGTLKEKYKIPLFNVLVLIYNPLYLLKLIYIHFASLLSLHDMVQYASVKLHFFFIVIE